MEACLFDEGPTHRMFMRSLTHTENVHLGLRVLLYQCTRYPPVRSNLRYFREKYFITWQLVQSTSTICVTGYAFLRTWLRLLCVCTSLPYPSLQVVILRHTLYALVGRDVMVASFGSVSAVTVGALSAMVGGVIALMLTGMTQVGEEYETIHNRTLKGCITINARTAIVSLSPLEAVPRKTTSVIFQECHNLFKSGAAIEVALFGYFIFCLTALLI